MSKDDTSGGFLSKVVKFVRHPTTSWADLDTRTSDRESEYSKAALKEMVERKRRNDFVRKREFDMLRKIRAREGKVGEGPGVRPSFFQSSLPSKPDDRAMTLKKIDEIEAQMSMQWWKTKGPDQLSSATGQSTGAGTATTLPPDAVPEQRRKAQYKETEGSPLGGNSGMSGMSGLSGGQSLSPLADAPTEPMPVGGIHEGQARGDVPTVGPEEFAAMQAARQLGTASQMAPTEPDELSGNTSMQGRRRTGLVQARPTEQQTVPATVPGTMGASEFSASHFFAMDVQEIAQDPEVEEASIRFANGDDQGAEQGLQEALAEGGAGVNNVDDWLALFDLYRATGQLAPFESRAVDFVTRFGRSAPQWFDMAEIVAGMSGKASKPEPTHNRASWACDEELDAFSVGTLQNVLTRVPQPWVLDWTRLETIEQKAARALLGLFTLWGDQQISVRMLGASGLIDNLKQLTPSGRRDIEQLWWELRLATLRLLNRADEFELAALDFCVTYEVSPPAWESPLCDCRAVAEDGSEVLNSVLGEVVREEVASEFSGDSFFDSRGGDINHLGMVDLSGEIRGDPHEILDALDKKLEGSDVFIISCSTLIRVDFSAAGTLLNWVSAHHAQGRLVQFVDTHRLVSAFFNVIGITEYAKVVVRND